MAAPTPDVNTLTVAGHTTWEVLTYFLFPIVAGAFGLLWAKMSSHERDDAERFRAIEEAMDEDRKDATVARERLRELLASESVSIRREIVDSRHLTMNTVQSMVSKLDDKLDRIDDRLDKVLENGNGRNR